MKWYVYRNDFNKREIVKFDIFSFTSFKEDVKKLFKKKLDRDVFSEELKNIARYHYWGRCEYEVVITSWPTSISRAEVEKLYNEDKTYRHTPNLEVACKVDIYDQLTMNWDVFVDYVYAFQK